MGKQKNTGCLGYRKEKKIEGNLSYEKILGEGGSGKKNFSWSSTEKTPDQNIMTGIGPARSKRERHPGKTDLG